MSSEFRHVCYRINILGSQLAPSSWYCASWEVNRIGLTSHWACITDKSGITTNHLRVHGLLNTLPTLQWSMAVFTFYLSLNVSLGGSYLSMLTGRRVV